MRIHPLLIATLGLALIGNAKPPKYEGAGNFSFSNPSGPWSYGFGVPGSSFTPMTVLTTDRCFGTPGLACWQPPNTVDGAPVIGHNSLMNPLNVTTVVLPPGVLLLHPGPNTDAILTWTAPASGTYRITGFFALLDVKPTGVIATIFNGSTRLFGVSLTGPPAVHPNQMGGGQSFSLTVTVTAGAVISFGVNNAGNFLNDSVGLKAIITPVP